MKKIFILLFTILLCTNLVACGSNIATPKGSN